MARTESHHRSRPEVKTLRHRDAILKAKSWSEFQSNLGDRGNTSKRIRVVIIYKIPGIRLIGFVYSVSFDRYNSPMN